VKHLAPSTITPEVAHPTNQVQHRLHPPRLVSGHRGQHRPLTPPVPSTKKGPLEAPFFISGHALGIWLAGYWCKSSPGPWEKGTCRRRQGCPKKLPLHPRDEEDGKSAAPDALERLAGDLGNAVRMNDGKADVQTRRS